MRARTQTIYASGARFDSRRQPHRSFEIALGPPICRMAIAIDGVPPGRTRVA